MRGGTGASRAPWVNGKEDAGKQELKKPREDPLDTMTNTSADVTERTSLTIHLERSRRCPETRPAEQESDCRSGRAWVVRKRNLEVREGMGKSGTSIPEMRASIGQPGAFLDYAAIGCSDAWTSFTLISDT